MKYEHMGIWMPDSPHGNTKKPRRSGVKCRVSMYVFQQFLRVISRSRACKRPLVTAICVSLSLPDMLETGRPKRKTPTASPLAALFWDALRFSRFCAVTSLVSDNCLHESPRNSFAPTSTAAIFSGCLAQAVKAIAANVMQIKIFTVHPPSDFLVLWLIVTTDDFVTLTRLTLEYMVNRLGTSGVLWGQRLCIGLDRN